MRLRLVLRNKLDFAHRCKIYLPVNLVNGVQLAHFLGCTHAQKWGFVHSLELLQGKSGAFRRGNFGCGTSCCEKNKTAKICLMANLVTGAPCLQLGLFYEKVLSANPASAFCMWFNLLFQALAGKTRSFLTKTTELL